MSDKAETSTTITQNTMRNNATIMELRLSTSSMISEIETYLTGTRIEYIINPDTKEPKQITRKLGEPKANEEGVAAIISRLQLILNPSIVQGNLDIERYKREIVMVRESIAESMMLNLERWGIDENDYEEIIDSIMTAIKMFLSRAIDNKERESYNESMKSSETYGDLNKKKSRIPFIG